MNQKERKMLIEIENLVDETIKELEGGFSD